MSQKKRRVPIIIKLLLIILVPVLFLTFAFWWIGNHYLDEDRIYPNIRIADVDVSLLTREEALHALDIPEMEERINNARVTIVFPDGSELVIRGEDIQLTHDAQLMVASAYSIGRGNGFVRDTLSFLRRLNGNIISIHVSQLYDLDALHTRVSEFTESYNNKLIMAEPLIYTDKIVITKGAGEALADEFILKDIAYVGLFESFDTNQPVRFEYVLPETKTNGDEIFYLHRSMFVPVRSAVLNMETLSVEDCVIGVEFDMIEAVLLLNETESGKTATIYMDYIQPEVTREYLESLLFRDLLGTETTHVHGNANRMTNVRLSAEAIDSLVLLPGEEFSFNEVVGPRSHARGYRPGGAFVGGVTVSVNGGGICQTASTLYSAIMDTEIQITERHPHGQPVPYLRRGRDATVFWKRLDFRFVNNTEFPIRIDFEMEDRNLTAQVYGTIIDDFPTIPLPLPAG